MNTITSSRSLKNRQRKAAGQEYVPLLYCIHSNLSTVFSVFTIKIRLYRYDFAQNAGER